MHPCGDLLEIPAGDVLAGEFDIGLARERLARLTFPLSAQCGQITAGRKRTALRVITFVQAIAHREMRWQFDRCEFGRGDFHACGSLEKCREHLHQGFVAW